MTTKELDLVKQIFLENPIVHSVRFNESELIDAYSIIAKYKTSEQRTVTKNVLTVSNTPDHNLFEIWSQNKCIYAKKYQPRQSAKFEITSKTEDSLINEILEVCRDKTSKQHTKKLESIRNFLNALKENQK